jgi:ribosomal protein L40E
MIGATFFFIILPPHNSNVRHANVFRLCDPGNSSAINRIDYDSDGSPQKSLYLVPANEATVAFNRIKSILGGNKSYGNSNQSNQETQAQAADIQSISTTAVLRGLVCPSCGKDVSTSDTKFGFHQCPYCGFALNKAGKNSSEDSARNTASAVHNSITCSKCSATNPLNATYCINCGAKVKLSCSSCSHSNPAAAKFCNQCGTSIDQTC